MGDLFAQTLNPIIEGHTDSLAIFQTLPMDLGVSRFEKGVFRPATTSNMESSCIEIQIDTSGRYADLSSARLFAEFCITHADGTPLGPKENVGVTNNISNSMFGQLDLIMNRCSVNKIAAPLISYKGYIDTIINAGEQSMVSWLATTGWSRDSSGAMDVCTRYKPKVAKKTGDKVDAETGEKATAAAAAAAAAADASIGSNAGFNERVEWIKGSRLVQIQSALPLDIFTSKRFLLNNIGITLRFWMNPPEFFLMSSETDKKYKIDMKKICVKMDLLTLQSEVIIAHNDILKTHDARYDYMKSHMRAVSIPQGNLSYEVENVFSGLVPSKAIFCLVKSSAFIGKIDSNPFNLQHFQLNKIGFYLNNFCLPSGCPQTPNFKKKLYVESYNMLFESMGQYLSNNCCEISYFDFANGYTIFAYDTDRYTNSISGYKNSQREYLPAPRLGSTQLVLNFEEPLPETVTLLIYGLCSDAMLVDMSRRVTV